MQRITKTEIKWIIGLLEKECEKLLTEFNADFSKNPCREIIQLRHDNLKDLCAKFSKVVDNGEKE